MSTFGLFREGGMGLQRNNTLKLNKEFRRLYYKGKSSVHPLVVTYAMRNRMDHNRMGITVTKKIGKAVSRNRCKRIIREAYRRVEGEIPQGWDFVFVARARTKEAKATDLLPVIKKQIESLTTQKPKPKKPAQKEKPEKNREEGKA